MTNRKSHTRFRLVPKSMTLDDHYICSLFQNVSVSFFGAHHKNVNEDRPILSATKMQRNDSEFWQYKVYADNRRGSQGFCKFCLDLYYVCAHILYTDMSCRSRRFQVQVFDL